jgi:hypothetical protein
MASCDRYPVKLAQVAFGFSVSHCPLKIEMYSTCSYVIDASSNNLNLMYVSIPDSIHNREVPL